MIQIQIKNQQIITDKTRCIIANSINHVTCSCTFDEEWSEYTKHLIFTNGEISKILIVEDGAEYFIPHEVLVQGKLEISAVGYGSGGEKRITTKKMAYPIMVHASGKITGDTPESYTPELWEQLSTSIGNLSDLKTESDTIVEAINNTSDMIGSLVPVTRRINNKSLDTDITLTAEDVSAAPAGFGLGDNAAALSGASGTIWKNGFYQWTNTVTDAPFSNAALQVINRDSDNAVQIAHSLSSTAAHHIARRIRTNGSTSEWEYFNPPMEVGVEYRTTEIWQGKPVYTKLINFGALPNTSIKMINVGVHFSQVISISGLATNGTGTALLLPSPSTSIWVNHDSCVVISTSAGSLTTYTALILLKYFKQ